MCSLGAWSLLHGGPVAPDCVPVQLPAPWDLLQKTSYSPGKPGLSQLSVTIMAVMKSTTAGAAKKLSQLHIITNTHHNPESPLSECWLFVAVEKQWFGLLWLSVFCAAIIMILIMILPGNVMTLWTESERKVKKKTEKRKKETPTLLSCSEAFDCINLSVMCVSVWLVEAEQPSTTLVACNRFIMNKRQS